MAVIKKTIKKPGGRASEKKPLSKSVVKKMAAKKSIKTANKEVTPKKSSRKASVKKPVSRKTHEKVRRTKSIDVVSLPDNMSVRTIEKTEVLKREFEAHFRRSMYQIAYVTGLCFILVGSTFAVSQLFLPDVTRLMPSQVSSAGVLDNTTTQVIPNPTFEFIDLIPDQLIEDFRVTFLLTDVEIVSSKLVQSGVTGFYDLKTNSLLEDKHRVTIPASSLTPGMYQLKIYVKPQNGSSGMVFESKEFQVGPDIIDEDPSETPDDSIGENEDVLSDTTDDLVDDTPDDSVDETLDKTSDTIDDDPASDDSDDEIQEIPIGQVNIPFSLLIPSGSILTDTTTIGAHTPDNNYPWIELYARPLQSLEILFVALANERAGQWYFIFDSTNLPNGRYELFARSKLNNNEVKTDPILVSVSNKSLVSPTETVSPDDSDGTMESKPIVRLLHPIFEDQTSTPIAASDDDVQHVTEALLLNNAQDIDTLFRHYATAQQSGDEILIETAREALEKKRQALVTDTLRDQKLSDISDNIDQQLSIRINDLEERVDTFEKLRKEKSEGETAIDTDKDGVSDFDERHLYGTNPEAVDTDNDGVTDGIEIMRGYNPNDAAPEAIIEFESPRETVGLVRDDVLTMKEVLPVVQINDTEDRSTVKTEIRGKGLPNSFVTLYIYSNPTVVTIRTDADGEFVYTFAKELEDGQHDIYIAMTDNAGEIIAQSSPFSFIKEAQAFTPVNAAEAEVITAEPIIESAKNTYNTVVGIGILALGLILLMLGISLRPKDDDLNSDSNESPNDNSHLSDNKVTRIKHIDAT